MGPTQSLKCELAIIVHSRTKSHYSFLHLFHRNTQFSIPFLAKLNEIKSFEQFHHKKASVSQPADAVSETLLPVK